MVTGPKYDGKYLHSIIHDYFGQLKLHDTLTNVVIPTFDIKILQPTIFSNFTVQILSIFWIQNIFCHLFIEPLLRDFVGSMCVAVLTEIYYPSLSQSYRTYIVAELMLTFVGLTSMVLKFLF